MQWSTGSCNCNMIGRIFYVSLAMTVIASAIASANGNALVRDKQHSDFFKFFKYQIITPIVNLTCERDWKLHSHCVSECFIKSEVKNKPLFGNAVNKHMDRMADMPRYVNLNDEQDRDSMNDFCYVWNQYIPYCSFCTAPLWVSVTVCYAWIKLQKIISEIF